MIYITEQSSQENPPMKRQLICKGKPSLPYATMFYNHQPSLRILCLKHNELQSSTNHSSPWISQLTPSQFEIYTVGVTVEEVKSPSLRAQLIHGKTSRRRHAKSSRRPLTQRLDDGSFSIRRGRTKPTHRSVIPLFRLLRWNIFKLHSLKIQMQLFSSFH